MPNYTVQAIIPTVDNVPANYATNTWHFFANLTSDLEDAMDALYDFYVTWAPNLSSLVRQTNWEFKAYNDADPEPRYPVSTRTFNQPSSISGAPLPPEVSLVLSFQAPAVSGTPQARRRGRVYLPFLDASTNHTDGRPTTALVSAVQTAADALLVLSLATPSAWRWETRSRVDDSYEAVTNGWIDNEWDTQRRRGRPYTVRTVF